MTEIVAYKPARYAKGQIAVHVESNGTGWKQRENYLAEALNGRWSHREKAYIMSPTKAERLKKLIAEGWTASIFGELRPPEVTSSPVATKGDSR